MKQGMLDPRDLTLILEGLLERGFEPPFHLVAVAANGAMFMGQYLEPADEGGGLEFNLVASHSPDEFFQTPVNMMLVDRRSEAARIVFDHDEAPRIISLN